MRAEFHPHLEDWNTSTATEELVFYRTRTIDEAGRIESNRTANSPLRREEQKLDSDKDHHESDNRQQQKAALSSVDGPQTEFHWTALPVMMVA